MNAHVYRFVALGALLLALALVLTGAALPAPAAAAPAAAPAAVPQRLLVEAKSAADFAPLRAELANSGLKVVMEVPSINMLVVLANPVGGKAMVARNPRVAGVAHDRTVQIAPPNNQAELLGKVPDGQRTVIKVDGSKLSGVKRPKLGITPDPAFGYAGLMWNVLRIDAPGAWARPLGSGFQTVKIAVEDTGLDYTHLELRNKVVQVVDFTVYEQPNICHDILGGPSDQQLAIAFSAPSADLDFHGHGSWIGGNIAASLNQTGTNGIAPFVNLVSLKIAQNCGYAYDSTILDAFDYAANAGIPIVSISFGGYLDRSDPEQDLIYRFYSREVAYARGKGTLVIAAAGNEHTRIGPGGKVVSHGILSSPPGGEDFFGLWENPGGIVGVVDVASTGNIVNAPSASCPADSLAAGNHQWCKPTSDAHQSFGVGKMNQLTYYSNYGPRIDLSAPGGARKFNVPAIDRGGCEGWPWCGANSVEGGTSTADGYNAWEDFSITSNWAVGIPCFTFTSFPGFPDNQCYAIIQGTSMATPHVSAVAGLIVSTHPQLLHNANGLFIYLTHSAFHLVGNTTPPVSATDTSPGDSSGAACPGAFCHLGGLPVPNFEAYGKYGFINALKGVLLP